MSFINEFPYSDFHQLNADWLIKKTKDLINRVTTLEAEMAEIELVTKEQIEQMISIAIANNNIQIANDLRNLYDQVTYEYQNYVNTRMNQLKVYIDNQDVAYDDLAKSYAHTALIDANTYTDDKILNVTMMVNPITGQYDDVRNVVNDIILYFHTNDTLTAGEYDALNMTAAAYDAKNITAYDYDYNGKNLLP